MGSLTGIRANLLSRGQHTPARSALGEISPAMIDCGIEPECGSDEMRISPRRHAWPAAPTSDPTRRVAAAHDDGLVAFRLAAVTHCASQTKSAPPWGGRGFLRTQLLGVVPAQAIRIPAQEWTLIGVRIVARRLPQGIER